MGRSARGAWHLIQRAAIAVTLLMSCWVLSGRAEEPAHFVDAAACSGCHAAETALWKTSHHAKAMQPATSDTVLGAVQRRGPIAERGRNQLQPLG